MADTKTSAGADEDIALGDLTEEGLATPHHAQDPEAVLASFRQEWQRELEGSPGRKAHDSPQPQPPAPPDATQRTCTPTPPSPAGLRVPHSKQSVVVDTGEGSGGSYSAPSSPLPTPRTEDDIKPDIEKKATELFNRGVELEQSGQLYQAIQHYRRAMTLVPDIEFRVHRRNVLERNEGYLVSGREVEDQDPEEDLDEEEIEDLVLRFQRLAASSSGAVCLPQSDQEAAHISCLPPEMLERILCWVVGGELDMRSLEQVARVCQGFYLLARNPEIWHKACIRIWGINCGLPAHYGSWRHMFIHRPHPRYNGCYISRTTYFRSGESSFQDQNYQPWHMVQYYRYLRFFADGLVHLLTTAEEPPSVVPQLRTREVRNSQVLHGHYRIHGSCVSLVFIRRSRERMRNRRKGRRYIGGTTDVAETTFLIEYEVRPLRERPHWQLVWRSYTIKSLYFDDRQNISHIDVSDTTKFPPMCFSRVKSYTVVSETPLL